MKRCKQRLCMFWMEYYRSLFTMCHQGQGKSQSTTSSLPEVGGTPTLYSATSPTPTGVSFASPISSPRKGSLTGDWAWLTSPAPPLDSLVASVLRVRQSLHIPASTHKLQLVAIAFWLILVMHWYINFVE